MLTFRGLDLQSGAYRFDLVRGYFEPPDVRGEDDVIPGRPGRDAMTREADVLRPRIEGSIIGEGATRAERQASWHDATVALMAVLDMTLASGALVVGPEPPPWAPDDIVYLGMAGEATLQARCTGMVSELPNGTMTEQRWSIDLEAVDGAFWSAEESS